MQDIISQTLNGLNSIINNLLSLIAPHTPPGSSIFIIVVATLTTILSTLISRKFIDVKKLKLYTRKTKEFQKLQRKALRSQDPILKKKVENQKATSQRMQSELMKMRMKPMLFTMIPLLLVFFSLNSYYSNTQTNHESLVANIPFDLPENIIFQFGVNCNYQRNTAIPNKINTKFGTQFDTINSLDQLNSTQLKSLNGNQLLCLEYPNLHYTPTYIGWYVAINVIINSVVTKVAGLMPD